MATKKKQSRTGKRKHSSFNRVDHQDLEKTLYRRVEELEHFRIDTAEVIQGLHHTIDSLHNRVVNLEDQNRRNQEQARTATNTPGQGE